ncbi:MAG: hypothetical protein FJ398_25190 [Verrucomicrobia bacterium]|nr:hypothetical protein [Verrucomicrobiota bacterium]
MLKPEDILALRDADPFVPFQLHLSDGRTVRVENRDFIWVGRHRITIGLPSGSTRLVDREERIALMHIASAEELV